MPEGGDGDGGEVPALIPDGEPLREEVPVLSGGRHAGGGGGLLVPEPGLERERGTREGANPGMEAEVESPGSHCGQ